MLQDPEGTIAVPAVCEQLFVYAHEYPAASQFALLKVAELQIIIRLFAFCPGSGPLLQANAAVEPAVTVALLLPLTVMAGEPLVTENGADAPTL